MTTYILRRVGQSVPTLLLVTLVLFFGMHALPGGPLAAFAFNPRMSPLAREAIIHRWGLDQPLYLQYFAWLRSMLTGDWQYSFFLNRPVSEAIASRLPATLVLTTTAFIIQDTIALPAGIVAALRRYSLFDQVVTFFSYLFYAMPTFWLGLIMILVFGVFLRVFPVAGIVDIRMTGAPFLTPEYNAWFGQHPLAGLADVGFHVILPAFTIALVGIAADSRFMRASMLDTIHQDFVRTARAKGLPERVVVLKHALRNALLPVVTNIALQLPFLFSGAVVTEAIFSWPGIGQLFFQALSVYDYPLLMGIVFVSACLIIAANLLADVCYALIDPRITYA